MSVLVQSQSISQCFSQGLFTQGGHSVLSFSDDVLEGFDLNYESNLLFLALVYIEVLALGR